MRRRFAISRRTFVIIETLCAAVFLYAVHMSIKTYTTGGRARDIVEWEAGHWAAGITAQPAKVGESGYLEPWYRTPNAEDATVVVRIYGAAALPGLPERNLPVNDPGLCVTVICPPLHAAPDPPSAPAPWAPWDEPPIDA